MGSEMKTKSKFPISGDFFFFLCSSTLAILRAWYVLPQDSPRMVADKDSEIYVTGSLYRVRYRRWRGNSYLVKNKGWRDF